jgi:DHA1 family bicyclomycin/chloramphenicol resistance-like MFS transporter
VVQGFGAASGAVIARAVLRDVYGPAGATQAISGMFLIMVWVPVTAPVLGGLVSALFDWRASFLVMAMVAGTTLVGAWLCLVETQPANLHSGLPEPAGWTSVLTHTTFLSHALANMFCVATLLIFLSNYSYLTEALYGLSARQNGYVLAGFNASIATGVYFVRFCVPRIGVEKSIRTGLWMACAGWILLATISPQAEHNPVFMLPCLAAACLGTGMVLTLTVGQALVPFTHAAATASALFIFMQSAGASTITHLATAFVDVTLLHLAVILSICALLALIISRLLGTMGGVSSNGTAHD